MFKHQNDDNLNPNKIQLSIILVAQVLPENKMQIFSLLKFKRTAGEWQYGRNFMFLRKVSDFVSDFKNCSCPQHA